MCGIAGLYNFNLPDSGTLENNVKNMLSMIHHRGPDESGVYLSANTAIGSVRLSIIDLSTGQQPLTDETGNYWIVYNGEVFNYNELRTDLIKKGAKFKTHSDTEVVVQMYSYYGPDCVNYFNGQFAFCIWDKRKKELFLARDRVGIRPLFYWSKNESFAFCSEIKGLFAINTIERSLVPAHLAEIFTFWTTLTPKTPFKDIYELQPGHWMKVSAEGIKIKKYWELNFSPEKKKTTVSFDETIEELDALLHDSVRIRLRADVPVGAYLSGGLDSSITTAFIKDIEPGVLNTFSIGFKNNAFDETDYQEEVAKYLNTNHTAFKCTSEEIAANFAKTIWHTEFPILRTSPTPMFLLSKLVRDKNIKVVITGEGADEFFAGYNIFKEAKIRRFWANDPDSKIRPKLLTKLYPYLPLMKESPELALRMFFGYKLTETNNPLYSHLLRWRNTSRLNSFFNDELKASINGSDPILELSNTLPANFNSWGNLGKAQYIESSVFMSGYLLSSQGDRMAMANSVEGRYPFLDYRIIEFCAGLPDNYKLNSLNEKYILKKLSAGRIPSSISNRPKQAYRSPIIDSFFHQGSSNLINDILSEEAIKKHQLFDSTKVKNLIDNISIQKQTGEIDQMALVGILSTQLLQDLFIKNPIISKPENLSKYKLIKEN